MTGSLFPFQADAITHLRRSSIHLALTAPTGSGKGVILERIAKNPAERILLLTPLRALARQQTLRFQEAGVERERIRILCPEAAILRHREISEWRPTLVAVDEAHCVYEWGESFRPAYHQLLDFLETLDCSRTLWMSATFPRSLVEKLSRRLRGPWVTQGRFSLPSGLEIALKKVRPVDRVEWIRGDVLRRKDPGLLFVGTRLDVSRYLNLLSSSGTFLPYHAGMSDDERRVVESRLFKEVEKSASSSVIATSAFGMGMNFPQFKWSLLAHSPYSLLALMQSFGRVARANHHGEGALYWAEEDFRFADLLLGKGSPRAQMGLALLRKYLEGSFDERIDIERRFFL